MQVDDEDRLKNIFWTELRNMETYKEFEMLLPLTSYIL